MQLLNYGGEDLSQEDLKIGTHVYFVVIMDGDVLSNTYTGWRVGTFLVLIEAEAEALSF